jgi:hypothetical protein
VDGLLTWTQAQYDSLKDAYAQGALRIKHGDKDVTFRTRKEMKAIIREVGIELGVLTAPVISYTEYDKGY